MHFEEALLVFYDAQLGDKLARQFTRLGATLGKGRNCIERSNWDLSRVHRGSL